MTSMLTPAFELNQDETFVYVYIKTPYIKVCNLLQMPIKFS